jgi:hypothetical protein
MLGSGKRRGGSPAIPRRPAAPGPGVDACSVLVVFPKADGRVRELSRQPGVRQRKWLADALALKRSRGDGTLIQPITNALSLLPSRSRK